jgi:hypothetical protein
LVAAKATTLRPLHAVRPPGSRDRGNGESVISVAKLSVEKSSVEKLLCGPHRLIYRHRAKAAKQLDVIPEAGDSELSRP